MSLVLVTPPEVEPITAQDVRESLSLGTPPSDLAVETWIRSERQKLDGANGALGRALITQTWDWALDAFPGSPWATHKPFAATRWPQNLPGGCYDNAIQLPLAPVQTVDFIEYRDSSGDVQTVDPLEYRLIPGEPALLVPETGASWPSPEYGHGEITIRFTAGYGDAPEDVPEPLRTAITMRIGLMRSLMGSNLFVQSETVDGIGSTNYSGGSQSTKVVADEVERLIGPYRLNCGIS
jgi:hypothetical protein